MSRGGERARLRTVALGLAAVLLAGACQVDFRVGPGDPDPEPDLPPDGVGLVVDWSDPSRLVEVGDGWVIRACEGDAPMLCVDHMGAHAGVVEALDHPMESYHYLDAAADNDTNLTALAAGFIEDLRSDREMGCGPGYRFRPIEPKPFVLANAPGIAYGFTGTTEAGDPSELILQYSTIVADRVILVVAAAYDEGGCPGRVDEIDGFTSDTLARFRPYLEMALHESPLPSFDG